MHMLQSLFCLTISLNDSGIIISHLQEHIILWLQHLVTVTL